MSYSIAQHQSYALATEPAVEPVTLAEVKVACQIDHDAADDELNELIRAARWQVEQVTGLALINQSWEIRMDDFPAMLDRYGRLTRFDHRKIEIARRPLHTGSVVVKYYDSNETEYTYAASNYRAVASGMDQYIVLKETSFWPIAVREFDGVLIEFDAGYGASADDVPDRFKTLIKRLVKRWYDGKDPRQRLLKMDLNLIRGDIPVKI